MSSVVNARIAAVQDEMNPNCIPASRIMSARSCGHSLFVRRLMAFPILASVLSSSSCRAQSRPKTSEYPEPSGAENAMDCVGILSLSPPSGGLSPPVQIVCASCRACFLPAKRCVCIVASVPRLQGRTPQPTPQRNAWTPRKNTGSHRFHDSRRYTIRRPVRTIWQGNAIKACRNRLNSSVSTDCFSAACLSAQRPRAGNHLSLIHI